MSAKAIDYLVSRFPIISETFIVRELDALATGDERDVGLRSLFPSPDPQVHDIARPWVDKLAQPGMGRSIVGLSWALLHHPLITMSILADIVRGYGRRPALLLRALATVPIATAHAQNCTHPAWHGISMRTTRHIPPWPLGSAHAWLVCPTASPCTHTTFTWTNLC